MSGLSLSRRFAALPAVVAALTLLAGCAVAPSTAAPGPGAVVAGGSTPSPSPSASVAPSPLPDPAVLNDLLGKVSRKRIGTTGLVVTTTDGTVLADRGADKLLTPASTMKLFTTTVALSGLGADRTFSTKSVDAGAGRIVLVGGGDPLLTNKVSKSVYKAASLQKLAQQTAAALKASGRTRVSLGYDASLFGGPTWNPKWKARWKPYSARISALEVDSGKVGWSAATNPPKTAASAFAEWLRKYGVKVASIRPAKAGATATELASVTSVPLSQIIKRTLKVSDNVAAETLSRHAAIAAGKPATFAGGAATAKAWLVGKGIWSGGARIHDASGLAPANKVTATMLAKVVNLALGDPAYAPILDGLPIAGRDGTLKHRFDDKSEQAGVGVVHAKTGTLSRLATMAGYVTTASGHRLVFAELANNANSYYTAYNWLDREAAVLARCGCN
jgi:D-alanyl-D-alanine carboxypeptidase/D-alanyl-D-alanine-endopeptidase (penicillin-binding protein 4)